MAATFKYSLAGKPIGRDGLGLMRTLNQVVSFPVATFHFDRRCCLVDKKLRKLQA